jgi:hypothetical protein
MSEFLEIAAALAAARDRLHETVCDQFGASLEADVLEVLLAEAHGLASLGEAADSALQAADSVLAEARSLGGLETP